MCSGHSISDMRKTQGELGRSVIPLRVLLALAIDCVCSDITSTSVKRTVLPKDHRWM